MSPRATESITKRSLRGVFWLATGAGVQTLVRLATTLVLARLIAPEAFGLIAAAMTVVDLTDIITQLGVGPALVQMRKLEDKHLEVGLSLSLLLGAVFCLSTFVLAPVLADFFDMPALVAVLRVLAVLFPIRSLSVVSTSVQRRNLFFRQLALGQVVAHTVAYACVAILLAALGFGVWALVIALVCEGVLRTSITLWQSPPLWRLGTDLLVARQLASSGISFTLAQVFSIVALRGDNVVVGRWLGAGPLAFYTRAYGLMTLPVDLISSIMQRVLFPAMAQLHGDTSRLAGTYRRGISLLALSLLPTSVLLSVLSSEVVALLLGPRWSEVAPPLRLLACGIYLRGSYKLSGTIADAVGAAHRNARIQFVYAILIVLSAWLGSRWGLAGVATGVALVLFVEFLMLSRVALEILGMRWSVFVGLHFRGTCAALLTLGVAAPIAWTSRAHGGSAIVTVSLVFAGGLATVALLLAIAPGALLGPSELWLARALQDQLGERAPRVGRVLRGLIHRLENGSPPKPPAAPVSVGGSDSS